MSRIDKYEPNTGGFRAPLAADWSSSDLSKAVAVGLDASGRVVKALGNTGYVGVVVLTKVVSAGRPVDVMQDGCVAEFPGAAGTNYFVDAANGAIVAGTGTATRTAPATAGSVFVGRTVEATRLEVRFGRSV